MTAETSLWERFVALIATLFELVRDRRRSVEGICRVLQTIKDDPNFEERFFGKTNEATQEPPKKERDLSTEAQLAEWQALYHKDFGIELDGAKIRTQERPNYPAWLVVVAKGITPNQVIVACRKQFKCLLYNEDLDVTVSMNDRVPTETYAVWIKATVAADPDLKNLSANALTKRNTNGVTLLEALLIHLFHFVGTGEHLDPETTTLCHGSRYSGGYVPCVFWYREDRELYVYWCYPQFADDCLRGRAVVS